MKRLFADQRAVSVLERSQATVDSRDGVLRVSHPVPGLIDDEVKTLTKDQLNAAWSANAIAVARAVWDIASAVAAASVRL